jgi:hypothetical protein
MIQQITLTINARAARTLEQFLIYHGYEWRHCYDDQNGIRAPYFATVPSAESREAWEDLIGALQKKDDTATIIPITY